MTLLTLTVVVTTFISNKYLLFVLGTIVMFYIFIRDNAKKTETVQSNRTSEEIFLSEWAKNEKRGLTYNYTDFK